MSKKKKSALRVALSRVHWKSFVILLLFALWLSPFFATPEFDKSDLKKVESVVTDIEKHHARASRSATNWLTFRTSDGQTFCYITIGEGKKSQIADNALELLKSYSGKTLTVYYTEKRSLSLMSLFLIDYERTVAIECGQDVIFSLDDFNEQSRIIRIEKGIISGVILLIALIVLFFPIIKENVTRNKKRRKKERKKAKKEMQRAKFEDVNAKKS